ncbi:MAG: RdgB/HAM1 family non-canonical purine NTP pyrophosphatase [Fidelibacterota bacterium]|nr:MAG: RdgB/HAM1 family non-canonical purine NTP pyrophosphatase [Candidatus Neomarinimicrobiota bacterium]
MKVVVGTQNRDKLREIKAIFADLPVELVDLDAFPQVEMVEESGTSLRDNALLKARAVFRETGLPAIADDTGLEVDALNGAPGVYAARFAGLGATYSANVEKLLAAMEHVSDERRTARFRTCAVYVDDSRELAAEGTIEGHITRIPTGENGFGYDPVFRVAGTGQTFGQMTDQEKHGISHRAKAFGALHQLLMRSVFTNLNEETPA